MLLLVLILVLIAFGLLVVALLSGSVLWAWVSVGISVAAAAVLLVDWLQRRNAVKAGAEAVAADPGSDAPRAAMADIEPVTEILPVIPRSGPVPGMSGSPQDGEDAPPARFDQVADSQQTVVMPVVQPSGSADRPSGAIPELTPSSGDSSPTVIESDSDRSPSTPPSSDADGGAGAARADSGEPAEGASAAADAEPTVVPLRKAPAGTEGADAEGRTAEAPTDEPAAGTAPAGTDPAQESASAGPDDGPAPDPEATVMVAARRSGAAASAEDAPADDVGPADAAVPPADPEGEPPEEPRDAEAAALVAGLADEVVVVDEQPRYHVTGCRSLAGKPVIPLPASEAVELGFTPCGWCSPDRTLAGRHQAAAR